MADAHDKNACQAPAVGCDLSAIIYPFGRVRQGSPRRRPGVCRGCRKVWAWGIAYGTVLAIGSRPAWKAGVRGSPDCRFEPCLFRHHDTVFGPSRLTISNLRAILKRAKDCIFIWSNVIIGSRPVSKAGVPQGIAGSSPACSARYAAVAQIG